jgi:hypothetical protein
VDDLNVIDQFMETFVRYIDSGFGLLGGDVGFLTTILIGIDITIAGLFWAMGGGDDIIGRFLKKILYVGVFALSVVRASDSSFQVKWIESEYERGSLVHSSHWTAMITVVIRPPRNAETLRKNPLGLYVEAIGWSRELEAPTPAAPAAPAPVREAPAFGPSTRQPPANAPLGSPLDPNLNAAQAAPQSPERNAQ